MGIRDASSTSAKQHLGHAAHAVHRRGRSCRRGHRHSSGAARRHSPREASCPAAVRTPQPPVQERPGAALAHATLQEVQGNPVPGAPMLEPLAVAVAAAAGGPELQHGRAKESQVAREAAEQAEREAQERAERQELERREREEQAAKARELLAPGESLRPAAAALPAIANSSEAELREERAQDCGTALGTAQSAAEPARKPATTASSESTLLRPKACDAASGAALPVAEMAEVARELAAATAVLVRPEALEEAGAVPHTATLRGAVAAGAATAAISGTARAKPQERSPVPGVPPPPAPRVVAEALRTAVPLAVTEVEAKADVAAPGGAPAAAQPCAASPELPGAEAGFEVQTVPEQWAVPAGAHATDKPVQAGSAGESDATEPGSSVEAVHAAATVDSLPGSAAGKKGLTGAVEDAAAEAAAAQAAATLLRRMAKVGPGTSLEEVEKAWPCLPSLWAGVTAQKVSKQCRLAHSSSQSPCGSPKLATPQSPSSSPKVSERRRRVRFNLDASTVHEIIPYGEIYGLHPREFVFDRHFRMVPAVMCFRFAGLSAAGGRSAEGDCHDEQEGSIEKEGDCRREQEGSIKKEPAKPELEEEAALLDEQREY